MSGPPTAHARAAEAAYVHEAYFYAGDDEFVASSVDFLTEGLRAGEHAVVAVVPRKLALLRAALGDQAGQVSWIDMAEHGRNPGRVIQLWRDILDATEARGQVARGIGEPIWAERSDAEILEAELHEALLNEAFDAGTRLWLRCPYDVATLPARVVETARVTHPEVADASGRLPSEHYAPSEVVSASFLARLPEPADVETDCTFGLRDLSGLRSMVGRLAAGYRLEPEVAEALVLAVREIAANSIRHGGGTGRLRAWVESDRLVCELSDAGHIAESMVGRLRPPADSESGRGVWLAHQLCDLVQLRSSADGTVVRLHAPLSVPLPSVG
jgi:anti-sigma regulatory factor (Ser/Thr protein kinase)